MTVSPEQREEDYAKAEVRALLAAAQWIEAKAGRRMTAAIETALTVAERDLLRAKRRLEATLHRLNRRDQ